VKFKDLFCGKLKYYLLLLFVGIILFFTKNYNFIVRSRELGLVISLVALFLMITPIKRIYWEWVGEKNSFVFKKGNKELSTPEKFVSDYFRRKKIKFIFEKPLKLSSGEVLKPDFYLPEFDVYVEVWGGYNNPKYYPKYWHRKKLYDENKDLIDLISLYPKEYNKNGRFNRDKLDWIFTSKLLELLKKRIR